MDAGNGVTIAGLVFQVVTMLAFGALVIEYVVRLQRNPGAINAETTDLRHSTRFRGFLVALAVAYTGILIRCVYRVAEMSGGWGSEIMRDEVAFNILDPIMCIIATCALNAFHPGLCFEGRVANPVQEEEKATVDQSSDSEGSIGIIERR